MSKKFIREKTVAVALSKKGKYGIVKAELKELYPFVGKKVRLTVEKNA